MCELIKLAIKLYEKNCNEKKRMEEVTKQCQYITTDKTKGILHSLYRSKDLDLIDNKNKFLIELKLLSNNNWGLEELLVPLYLFSQGRVKDDFKDYKFLCICWNKSRESQNTWQDDIKLLLQVTGERNIQVEEIDKNAKNLASEVWNKIKDSKYSYIEITGEKIRIGYINKSLKQRLQLCSKLQPSNYKKKTTK